MKYEQIVIWGLRDSNHSHRFIHQAYYENFFGHAEEVLWLNDSSRYHLNSYQRRLILASGMASQKMPILPNTDYILHNVALNRQQQLAAELLKVRILKLQVYTKESYGDLVSPSPLVLFDELSGTLFQPWGVPLMQDFWVRTPNLNRDPVEYWVGSIWNNRQNQGNRETINRFKRELYTRGIEFKRVGRSKFLRNSVTEIVASDYVYRSAIGAAVVGSWQQNSTYVPCRIFKNIAAGVPPTSNGDYQILFGESQLYNPDLGTLIDIAREESFQSRMYRLRQSQDLIMEHTYQSNIKRLLKIINQL